jgi:hypothetical protein
MRLQKFVNLIHIPVTFFVVCRLIYRLPKQTQVLLPVDIKFGEEWLKTTGFQGAAAPWQGLGMSPNPPLNRI